MKRTWGASEQKIVAAKQNWHCASCNCTLPAAYELDHVIALSNGGEDCHETNAEALCPSCHAAKTQRESIQRTKRRRKERECAVLDARHKAGDMKRSVADAEHERFLGNAFLRFAYIPTQRRPTLCVAASEE